MGMIRSSKPSGLGFWMVIAVCLFTSFGLIRTLYEGVQKYGIVAERQRDLRTIQAENKRLTEAVAFADTPQFVEREARNKLGLVKEGETIVLIGSPSAARVSVEAAPDDPDKPNWRLWWDLFF